MADHPLPIPAVRVRALLAGSMTQIRLPAWREMTERELAARTMMPPDVSPTLPTRWQRVKAGDRLIVKEAFTTYYKSTPTEDPRYFIPIRTPMYAVDYAGFNKPERDWDWSAAQQMPRHLSRLTLTVTAVKQEPLQSISEEDARAEGIERDDEHPTLWKRYTPMTPTERMMVTGFPRVSFQTLWNSLHGPGAWKRNEEVCAISFVCHHANIDASEAA